MARIPDDEQEERSLRNKWVGFPFLLRNNPVIGPVALLMGLGAILFSLRDKLIDPEFFHNVSTPILVFGGTYLLVGIGIIIFRYIETGSSRIRQDPRSYEVDKVYKELAVLRKSLSDSRLATDDKNIDPKEMDSVIKEKITYALDYTLKDYIEEKYSANAVRLGQLKHIESQIFDLQTGVNAQIGKLSRSATINLIIGLFTTAIGISVLAGFVIGLQGLKFETTTEFLFYLVPRFSIAIFVEIFSFFFLKLYKTNLEDVKYFQNERTNIDSKVIALKTSLMLEDSDSLKEIMRNFSTVERNFILKKDETTIHVERIRLDNEYELGLVSKISEMVEKVRGK